MVVPESYKESALRQYKNVLTFPDNLNKVSIFHRQYLMVDEFGGVSLPQVSAFNVKTGEKALVPARDYCKVYDTIELPGKQAADTPVLFFCRSPRGLLYPNSPAEYVVTANDLNEGQVATIQFKPEKAPQKVSEYPTADVLYW